MEVGWTTPRKGEPGMEPWPDEYLPRTAPGRQWISGTYDHGTEPI